jgi:hypothetical protein
MRLRIGSATLLIFAERTWDLRIRRGSHQHAFFMLTSLMLHYIKYTYFCNHFCDSNTALHQNCFIRCRVGHANWQTPMLHKSSRMHKYAGVLVLWSHIHFPTCLTTYLYYTPFIIERLLLSNISFSTSNTIWFNLQPTKFQLYNITITNCRIILVI